MLKASVKIWWERKEPKVLDIPCSHCGNNFMIGRDHVRVSNYCSSCK